jgi:hypothetical protein
MIMTLNDTIYVRNPVNEDDIYRVDGTFYYVTDSNYGADRDGNRGSKEVFLDDFSYEVFDESDTKVLIDKDHPMYDLLLEELYKKADDLAWRL